MQDKKTQRGIKLTQQEAEERSMNIGIKMIGEYVRAHSKTLFECPICKDKLLVTPASIWSGNTTKCNTCSRKAVGLKLKKGYKKLDGTTWCKIQHNLKRKTKTLEFNITIEQAWDQYEKQKGRCFYSGLPIRFRENSYDTNNTCSLDRRDSSKGYTIENITWVHKEINRMKMDMSEKDFLKFCLLISENTKERDYGSR